MNLTITKVVDIGDITNERIVMKALIDLDIGRYGIFRTRKNTNGRITNDVLNAYWFPDKLVKAGDLIVLYTKSGVSSEKKNTNGSDAHFLYWGLSSPIWNTGTGTVLVSIPEWKVYTEK